jgi:hypothetical protein
MLRLALRPGEPIRIEHAGEVLWLRIEGGARGGRYSVVFDGPRSMEVMRNEALPIGERYVTPDERTDCG